MPATTSDRGMALCGAAALDAGPVRLVPFCEGHLSESYVGWLNNPAVGRFSEQRHHRHSLDSCRAYVAGFACGPGLLWAIERASDGLHLGNVSAAVDTVNGIADIGILLGPSEARGRGYGLAAWSAALGYLAARRDLGKVTGGCLATNTAMVQIMKRSGMVPDGYRLAHYLWEGRRVDLLYRALFCTKAPKRGDRP